MFRLFCFNNIYYIYNLNWGQSKLNSNNIENIKHGKDFEILSFLDRPSGTSATTPSFVPNSIKRLSDGIIFNIGDLIYIKNLKVVTTIKEFSLLDRNLYVKHTYNGIGVSLNVLSHYEKDSVKPEFYVLQVVSCNFIKAFPITATIKGVHIYNNVVKYDLQLWLEHGEETRIYNVEEKFLTAK